MLSQKLKNYHIILASQSPRRSELLADLDIEFEVKVKPDIAEDYPQSHEKEEIVLHLAEHKANAYLEDLDEKTILITADTIVCVNDEILEKPKNIDDAARMLRLLSDNEHQVFTGVCLCSSKTKRLFYDVSTVHFKKLEEAEIQYYVQKYKPLDKAGAYGIQEWIGYMGIDWIKGSYYNIMGLPVHLIYEELGKFIEQNEL